MAARELSSDDLFFLADMLGVKLVRDRNKLVDQLSGAATLNLRVFDGLSFPLPVKLVDSGVYVAEGKAGVVAHVCGSLYFVLLVDAAESHCTQYLQLWLVDGSKLGWASRVPPVVFASLWSRRDMYRKFVDGVVGGYHRTKAAKNWQKMLFAKTDMQDYVGTPAQWVVPTEEHTT